MQLKPCSHCQPFSAALCRGLIEARQTQRRVRARSCFPRLYAAASLKPGPQRARRLRSSGFPRLYAAASLKHRIKYGFIQQAIEFSAALCRGLIEAWVAGTALHSSNEVFSAALCRGLIEATLLYWSLRLALSRFPRLYAAASLKLGWHRTSRAVDDEFSAALCRGLIEASIRGRTSPSPFPFSAALCRGLIEAAPGTGTGPQSARGFPRLYAAASLKLQTAPLVSCLLIGFPRLYAAASLKRVHAPRRRAHRKSCFPRLYAAASLKRGAGHRGAGHRGVFRGFMPRPH